MCGGSYTLVRHARVVSATFGLSAGGNRDRVSVKTTQKRFVLACPAVVRSAVEGIRQVDQNHEESRPRVRGDGPVFISYRQSDGTGLAELVDTFLRSGGIVPWRDRADLAGGETATRIREAFGDGLSAAILLVTRDIKNSRFIPRVELPELRALDAKRENGFVLYVLNAIRANHSQEVAIDMPDRLLKTQTLMGRLRSAKQIYCLDEPASRSPREMLRQIRRNVLDLRGGENSRTHSLREMFRGVMCVLLDGNSVLFGPKPLKDLKQYQLLPGASTMPQLLTDLLKKRVLINRKDIAKSGLVIRTQTRPAVNSSHARREASRDADLHIRLQQDPVTSLPEELGYHCLQHALPRLVDVIDDVEAKRVILKDGGHASLIWAICAALPDARNITELAIVDSHDKWWWDPLVPDPQTPEAEQEAEDEESQEKLNAWTTELCRLVRTKEEKYCVESLASEKPSAGEEVKPQVRIGDGEVSRPAVVVFVSNTKPPTLEPVAEMAKLVENCKVIRVIRIEHPDGIDKIPQRVGARLASDIADKIRKLNREFGGAEIHLASSTADTIIGFTARYCNTVPVVYYELAAMQSTGKRIYMPVIRTDSGAAGGPITHVYPRLDADGHPMVSPAKVLRALPYLQPFTAPLIDGNPHDCPGRGSQSSARFGEGEAAVRLSDAESTNFS